MSRRVDDDLLANAIDRSIAEMVLRGQTNKAIASALGLSEGAVKWRLHRLYRNFGVSSRSQFVLALRDRYGR